MSRLTRSILPLWHLAQRLYYDWALREINPLHPDVPHIVMARAKLPPVRKRGAISWWLVAALAAGAWILVVSCDHAPIANTTAAPAHQVGADRLPALGAIERAQIEHQAHALCARHAGARVSLPDGVLTCGEQPAQRSVITTYHRKENTPWNGPTSF